MIRFPPAPARFGPQAKGNILFLIGTLELGGAEKHVVDLAGALKRKGWNPEIFVFRARGPLISNARAAKVRVHSPPTLRAIRLLPSDRLRAVFQLFLGVWSVWRTVRETKPRLMHFFLPGAYVAGGLAGLFCRGTQQVMSRRSLNFYQQKNRLYGRVERLLHRRMAGITGNSRAVLRQLEEEGVSPSRLALIPNGISRWPVVSPATKQKIRKKLGLPARNLILVQTANLIPYKGHEDLIRGLALVNRKLSKPWLLCLLGRDDGIRADLENSARRNGLHDKIRFFGSIQNVAEILRAADLGILCSHEEGFSNAILEYMAAGLPVVATRVGGNPDAVVHGKTGLLVPVQNPTALARAILQVTRPGQARRMGNAGRARVRQLFSRGKCVRSYENFYQRLLARCS